MSRLTFPASLYNSKLITDIDSLKSIIENEQKSGKCVVFTNGCFDIIHPGHIFILEQAKLKGDILVVGLNSDQSIKSFKSDLRPICPQDDRAYVLAGLTSVDYIYIFRSNLFSGIKEKKFSEAKIDVSNFRLKKSYVKKFGDNLLEIYKNKKIWKLI